MPKTCPPGVFCIENYTIFAIFCILFVVMAYMFLRKPTNGHEGKEETVSQSTLSQSKPVTEKAETTQPTTSKTKTDDVAAAFDDLFNK